MMVALTPFNLNEVESKVLEFQILDDVWKATWLQVHPESYLGPLQFEHDFRRVLLRIKKQMGFKPESWFYMS